MRQDKDRSSKWLIDHHGDAILKLAGITGFSAWRAVQAETVAPRRLPDGLLEVRFPGTATPVLVLVEIESYPSADADRQVFEDVAIVFLERRRVPEVVSLILKPKGQATVTGTIQHVSVRNTTRIGGTWPVIQLWDLTAEALFAEGDVGLMPWVSLTRSEVPPAELLGRCVERIAGVPNEVERAGLLAVTQILAGFAFPDQRFLQIFGGPQAMIESPVLDEAYALMEKIITEKVEAKVNAKMEAQVAAQVAAQMGAKLAAEVKASVETATRAARRQSISNVLEARFGSAPIDPLAAVDDLDRLNALVRFAATCPSIESFLAELNG